MTRRRWTTSKWGDRSTNETAVVQPTLLFRLVILLLREGVPEPESLVACASHDGFSLWTHREVQNTMGVTSQRGDHVERWILPDANLVLRSGRGESMGGYDFVRR